MSMLSTVAVGLCWVATSAILSTRGNSHFVAMFHDAMAHNCVRFSFSSCCGYTYFRWRHRLKGSKTFTGPAFWHRSRVLLCPSVLLFSANLANSMSLERTGISVTYVFKSLIPFLTVIVCWLGGQRFPWRIYACLVPICVGVLLATVTDLQFDSMGAVFAFSSALAQTGLNITSKRAILKLKASGMEAFFVMSTTCAFLSVPLLCIWSLFGDNVVSTMKAVGAKSAAEVIVQAGLTYFMEYSLNFAFVSLCSPLAFSITDICRRVATVLYGAVLTGTPLTFLNLAGVAMSLSGALLYSCMSLRLPPAGAQVQVKMLDEKSPPEVLSNGALGHEQKGTVQQQLLGSKAKETDSEASTDSRAEQPADREAAAVRRQNRYTRRHSLPAEGTCISPQALCSWSVSPGLRQRKSPGLPGVERGNGDWPTGSWPFVRARSE